MQSLLLVIYFVYLDREVHRNPFYVVIQELGLFFDEYLINLFRKSEEEVGSAGEQPISNKIYGFGYSSPNRELFYCIHCLLWLKKLKFL
jgi:hypothetical protein